jgi:hypothetical protein
MHKFQQQQAKTKREEEVSKLQTTQTQHGIMV